MSKTIIAVIIIIIIVGLGYWIYQLTIAPEELSEKEQACLNSGGQVSTSLCCKSTDDFPNLCLIGPCGCSPDNSHQVKICDCGLDRCFDGKNCIPAKLTSEDEISDLLEILKTETKIDFPEIEIIEFSWHLGGLQEKLIEGKGFKKEMLSEEYENVNLFFQIKGFERDGNNTASGMTGSLDGYKINQIVCVVIKSVEEIDKVACGELD